MVFNSYVFIFLMLPISVTGYYLINRKSYKGGQLFLLVCSMIFIGFVNIMHLLMLIPSILINYLLVYLLNGRYRRNNRSRKIILATGVTVNVLALVIFKYMNFFAENINRVFGTDYVFSQIILPLGISFYTFKQISCLVDYYKDDALNCSLLEYGLYVSFYPQFTQGPIVLQSEFIPQLRDESRRFWDSRCASEGLYRFTLGLAKKVLVADTIAKAVDGGYMNLQDVNALGATVLILGYTLQIYFDFSAYSDMAVGLGLLFHIDTPENFNSPYKAHSIGDFWDRWHITLTRFFTRYVYIPLGGSRKGNVRTYVNILIIFFLSGLWHGADWSFVIWGVMHGVATIISRLSGDILVDKKKSADDRGAKDSVIDRVAGIIKSIIVFVFVNIAWVFFRADDLKQAKTVLLKLFSGGWNEITQKIYESFGSVTEVSWILRMDILHFEDRVPGVFVLLIFTIMVIICMLAPNSRELTNKWSRRLVKADGSDVICKDLIYSFASGIMIAVLLVWCVISLSVTTTYVYWNF